MPTTSHHRHKSQNKNPSSDVTTKTSIDLELDLAAQQSKLMVLSEEIERLRQIKNKMEEAKAKGDKELPIWLQEDEKFQTLLASVSTFSSLKKHKAHNLGNITANATSAYYTITKPLHSI